MRTQRRSSKKGRQPALPLWKRLPAAFYHWEWLIVFAALLSDFNSWNHRFVMDDLGRIVGNPRLQSLSGAFNLFTSPYNAMYGMPSGLYRPLTSLTFAFNTWSGGLDTWGFHLVNRLIHVLICLVIFWLIRRLFLGTSVAAVTALLFAVHPLQTEAVTYINGRSDSLSALFFVAALLLFVRAQQDERSRFSYAGSLACYLIALLSKESAMTWMAVALLTDFVYGSKRSIRLFVTRVRDQFIKVYLGYFLVTFLYLAIRFSVLREIARVYLTPLDNPLAYVSVLTRIQTALKLLFKALELMIWPVHLSADYSYNQISLITQWNSLSGWLVWGLTVALISVWIFSLKSFPNLFYGLGFFLICYVLISNVFVTIGTIFAERLLYQPLVGICLLAALGFRELQSRSHDPTMRKAVTGALVAVLVLLTIRTVIRNGDWRDELTLYAQTVQASPNSAKAHNNLGAQYLSIGNLNAAKEEFQRAETIKPDYPDLMNNFGTLFFREGKFAEAISQFRRAVSLAPKNPEIGNNLGLALRAAGDLGEAIREYDYVLQLYPGNADAHFNKANALNASGRVEEAIQEYTQVLTLDPGYAEARTNLNILLQKKERD